MDSVETSEAESERHEEGLDARHGDEERHGADAKELEPGPHKIEFIVRSVEGEEVVRHEKSSFIIPR